MVRRIHVIVHGHVQGVGFRWATRNEAQRLGLSGWVRNLDDGTVEAEAQGPEGDVERMRTWLAAGPRGARVARLDVSEADPDARSTAFTLRDTP
ncbi:acylphosphatase [Microbacterium sp. cx-55]|uniref:acylphosphatase n=1 Tax=Microbacterium sp. cx-55 TaxID=2875948 RepID=UPI001CC04060|nr:acylphosphatase [Microbacterium sp. cx-55]MBZ4487929.1 acylphosphatase [Microbacterium sp. cx-55]UGB34660.1 acylphosphatase [Microbacterium sp. cx-55]